MLRIGGTNNLYRLVHRELAHKTDLPLFTGLVEQFLSNHVFLLFKNVIHYFTKYLLQSGHAFYPKT